MKTEWHTRLGTRQGITQRACDGDDGDGSRSLGEREATPRGKDRALRSLLPRRFRELLQVVRAFSLEPACALLDGTT